MEKNKVITLKTWNYKWKCGYLKVDKISSKYQRDRFSVTLYVTEERSPKMNNNTD